ncbi:MAG: helix-turn-helix transcriptional regulator [Oscillospiraceae bacterium]|nr:helix-turn-helix transcriptional regulator [Oscillospiraceae bacterium]
MNTRLKELRIAKGFTQLKVALDLNLTQNTVSRYETGEREAGYKALIAFADYYNVSIDYILMRTDVPR